MATGLNFGTTYEFKVESRNSYSYSPYSSTLSLYCGFKPEPPLTITTTNSNDVVVFNWDLPVNNGATVTAYKVYIKEKDTEVFTQETVTCAETTSTVVNDRTCSPSLTLLRAAPYNLVVFDPVVIKIVSVNSYGDSDISEAGDGAII